MNRLTYIDTYTINGVDTEVVLLNGVNSIDFHEALENALSEEEV